MLQWPVETPSARRYPSALPSRLLLTSLFLALQLLLPMPRLEGQVSGIVIDASTQNPIPGALVTWQATLQRTVAAADGTFNLDGINGTLLVIAGASKGYYNSSIIVSTPANSVQIELDPVPVSDDPTYSFVIPDQCSVCHPEQFTQWEPSRMAMTGLNSWVYDLFDGSGSAGGSGGFVYSRDSAHASADPSGHCASCHQPEGWIANPLQPLDPLSGPLTDPQRRGVSCETCHKIADVNESQINATGFVPGAVTVTRPDTSGLIEQVMYGMLGDVDFNLVNQMRGSYQPQLAAEACAVCHQYSNDPDHDNDFNESSSVAAQETYSEWKNSPYGDPQDPLFQSCVDCHMPPFSDVPVEACAAMFPPLLRDPSTVHTHDIRGTSAEFLENSVTMTLAAEQVGDSLVVDVQIVNDQAGHSVPTGVTLRNMILKIEATGPGNQSLSQTAGDTIDPLGGVGDPATGHFAALPGKLFAKVNQDISGNTGVLFTEATSILLDTRIAALATDNTSVTFDISGIDGEVNLAARLIYRRAPRAMVDAKGWSTDGLGQPLADAQAPHFGHLMESSDLIVPVASSTPPFLFQIPALVIGSQGEAEFQIHQVSGAAIDCGAFAVGVRNDPVLLTPNQVTGSTILTDLDGGAGPEFFEISLFPDGWTAAVVFDFLLIDTLQFPQVTTVLTTMYTNLGIDPATLPSGDVLTFADDLGSPGVTNLVSSAGGQGYSPAFAAAPEIIFNDSPSFSRGDCNGDGLIDIGDPIFTLGFLFNSVGSIPCDSSCDANDDALLDIADPVRVLSFLFSGALPLPQPTYPICAEDPTPDLLECATDICP